MAFGNSRKDEDKEQSSAQQNTQQTTAKPVAPDVTSAVARVKQVVPKSTEPYKPDYDQFAQTHDEHVLNVIRTALSVQPEAQKKMDAAILKAGKQIGYGLNDQEKTLIKALNGTGITSTAMGSIDFPSASMDTLVRATSGIPDEDRRKEAYAYLKSLTMVKGGRFYGYSLTGSDPGYIDSADMPKSDYDTFVKDLGAQFYSSKGHDEENLRNYLDLYDTIQGMALTDVQKSWYTTALKDAYSAQTGMKSPSVYELRKALDEYDRQNAEQTEAGEEEKKGWFDSLKEKLFGGKEEDAEKAEAAEPTPSPSPLPTPAAPAPEETPTPEATTETKEVQGPPAPTETPAPSAAQETQEPVPAPLKAPEIPETPEVQGPPAPQRTQEEPQAPAPGSVNLAGDPVRAITQYVKTNRGNELDEETRQAVNDYIGSSKSAQVVMGMDAADTVSMYEAAENDPFALSRANAARFDLFTGNVSSVIGSTLGGYYARIQSESFPESLRDDALGVLMDVGRAAEEAYRSGQIDVPEDGNLYEAYLAANPRALDNLKGAFQTLYEMNKEAREQARQTEEQAALDAKEQLDLARSHVRSGDFTSEDYALVKASAPVITTADALDDETYSDAITELRGAVSASYGDEGGWFNEQTERYLRAVGLNVSMDSAVALDYKDTLAGYVQDEILNDLRVAKALGYDSLGAYYDRQGGMSLDTLYARATLSMERFGQSLTQEDVDAAEALVSPYQGTGEDVSALDVLGTGIKLGSVSTGSEYYEAIWTMGQNANANRADLQSKARSEYTQQWGPALAGYMLTQDWLSAMDSGATPSEEYANYVRAYIAGGGDVFLLGPPPSMDNFALRKAVESDAAVAQTMQYVQQNMNASQGRWVDIISNTTSNVEMQAMATVVSSVTHSSVLGTAVSFGLTEYSPTVREQLANGRTLSQANTMGLTHAATTAIANAPTSGKFTGKVFNALGITPGVLNGAAMAGSTAPAKTMAGMIKAFGTGFLKGAGEMAVDELFIDEAKERGLWAFAGGTGEALMDGAGVLEAIGAGLAGTDVTQIGKDIIADAPEGFVCMLPMIFMGGLSDGVSGVKANWPKTTRAAQTLAQTGTAEAAQEFVAAMNEEIKNPEARQELNDAMQAAAAGQAAAGALLTDPDIRQKAESAQKAVEQAQSHEATLASETARREVAREGYEHAKEIGDVDAQLAAVDEYTKASHNMAEAQREAQQKRTEADSLTAQAVGDALRKGEAYAGEQRRAVERAVISDAVSAKSETTSNTDAKAEQERAQASEETRKGKTKTSRAEESVLSSLQTLAGKVGVGLQIKSDRRFGRKGYNPNANVAGYYINGERSAVVRSKQAGKLSVTGHEIGHAIQEQIGFVSTDRMIDSLKAQFPSVGAYKQSQYGHEAFAEFFWRYLADRDRAVDFADEETVSTMERLLREKGLLKYVQTAQIQVMRYLNASTEEKIGARIVNRSDAKKRQDTGLVRRIETAFLDDTAIAEDVQDVIRAATGEKVVSIEDNLRSTILFNRRASARASYILTDALVDKHGDVIYKSLADVFSDAGLKGKDFNLFWEYELAKHSLDRDSVKRSQNQVFDEESISTEDRKSFIAKMEQEHPEFKAANSEFQKWRRVFLDAYLVDEGFLGPNGKTVLDALDRVYPNYVPTYRAKGKKGKGSGRTYQMRTATGSTEDIIHPLDSFVGMVNSIVQMTADNDSKLKFAELYDRYADGPEGEPGRGMGYFANEITQDMERVSVSTADIREEVTRTLESLNTDPEAIAKIAEIIGDEKVEYRGTGRVDMNNVITVRNADGSKRYFEIYNPELFMLLAGADNGRSGLIGKTLGPLTRVMSMLTTGSNPVFGITNAMRDFQNSVNYGSWASNYLTGAFKWIATLKDAVTNSDVSKEYDALGGAGWQMFDTASKKSTEQLRGELFKGYRTSSPVRAAKTIARGAFKFATMEKVNEVIEKTSRLAEYKYGQHDRSTAQGRMEAFLAAQDVTTDFSRHGRNSAILSDLRSLVPFFNASLQGIYRTARQATTQESGRAGTRFAKNVLNAALASALANALILKYSDDDDVEDFAYLSDDLRAKHMFLPNFAPDFFGDAPFIRIPLDQNPLSYAVNAAVSNFIWTGAGADNEAMIEIGALADAIMDNLNPISSTILDPAIATQTNTSWYGSNIVPTYLQDYEPVNQYTEDTPTAFVSIAKVISDLAHVQISPMMLKYLAEQYSGYIGQTVIPALKSEKGDENGLLTRLSQSLISTARKRVTSDPLTSNDVISQVYDSYYDMTAVQKEGRSDRVFDIQYLDPAMSNAKAQAAIDEAYSLTHKGGVLYEAKQAITDGYNRIDEVEAMEDLSDQEKAELERSIRREMIEVALDAKEAMEDYDARYRYSGILPRYFYRQMLNMTE